MGIQGVGKAVEPTKIYAVVGYRWGGTGQTILARIAAVESPVDVPALEVQAERFVPKRDSVNAVAQANDVGRNRFIPFCQNLLIPLDFSRLRQIVINLVSKLLTGGFSVNG